MPQVKRQLQKQPCYFDDTHTQPYYRDVDVLSRFVSERRRILPAIYTSLCAKHQRQVTKAIKHARHLALLPFVSAVN